MDNITEEPIPKRIHSVVKTKKILPADSQDILDLMTLQIAISRILGQGGETPEILGQCLQELVDHLDLTFARLWIYNPEANLLELQAIAGQHSHTDDFYSRIAPGISIIGFIAQTRSPYVTNAVGSDMIVGAREWVAREEVVAFGGYPLLLEERLIGVLAIFSRHPLSQMVQTTLECLVNHLALAIDRAWVREELMKGREALLFRLASQIRKSLDLDTILNIAVEEIRALLQIDRCDFIWCWIQSEEPILAVTHESRAPELTSLLGDCTPEQAKLLGESILNQTLIRVNQVALDSSLEAPLREMLTDLGITAQLFLPLETRSGQLGAIACSQCHEPRFWTDSEVGLLQAVVDQLALAIDQAELYAQSKAVAFAAQTQAQQLSEALQNLKQTQSQLIQSEKMSSLGQMVAGIAHEINNPVNFISGNLNHASNYIEDMLSLLECYQTHYPEPVPAVEALAEEMDITFIAQDLPKLLSSMRIGADRIRQIVLSLRNFSRLDEAEMKPVDIHEGIDNTLLILQSRLKPTAASQGIEVIKDYGSLPKVECYAGQLNQVFMNILANAIDAIAAQPDPRRITIRTVLMDATPQQLASVAIYIADNGAGIPPTILSRLFDPFFTTKPVGKGTGLGLSISYQIVVDKHGGQLTCRSESGQGSEFCIQIPIAPDCYHQPGAAHPSCEASSCGDASPV